MESLIASIDCWINNPSFAIDGEILPSVMANISGDIVIAIGKKVKKGRDFPSGENRSAICRQGRVLRHSVQIPTHCVDSSLTSSGQVYFAASYI